MNLLTKLAQSDLAQRDDCLLLDVFQGRVLDELLRNSSDLQARLFQDRDGVELGSLVG